MVANNFDNQTMVARVTDRDATGAGTGTHSANLFIINLKSHRYSFYHICIHALFSTILNNWMQNLWESSIWVKVDMGQGLRWTNILRIICSIAHSQNKGKRKTFPVELFCFIAIVKKSKDLKSCTWLDVCIASTYSPSVLDITCNRKCNFPISVKVPALVLVNMPIPGQKTWLRIYDLPYYVSKSRPNPKHCPLKHIVKIVYLRNKSYHGFISRTGVKEGESGNIMDFKPYAISLNILQYHGHKEYNLNI